MSDRTRLVILVCCCLLVSLGVVAVGGVVADDDPDATGNETDVPIHEHPDDVADDGDIDALAGFLGGALGDRFEDHAISVSEGEYDRARNIFGDEFTDDLSRFAELEDDVDLGTADEDDEEDTSPAETIEETAEQQEEYGELIEEFEELQEAYEQARDAGDDERARELARELAALSERLIELGVELETRYEFIEQVTGVDLADGREAIADQTETVRVTAEEIQTAEFEPVLLDPVADVDRLTPLGTAAVTVVVTDGNETPVEGGTIRLVEQPGDVDHDAVSPTVTAGTASVENGTARLLYQPLFQSPDRDSVHIEYQPEPGSVYLGAETDLELGVDPIDATVSLTDVPETVTYGDTVGTTASIGVDEGGSSENDASLDGVPLRAAFGGDRTDVTTTAGNAELVWSVDETTPAGDLPLSVGVPTGLPVQTDMIGQTVTVEQTATRLNATVTPTTEAGDITDAPEQTAAANVDISLATETDSPVSDVGVELLVDGATVETIQTDETGTGSTTLDIPEGDRSVTVRAIFEPQGGSLADAADQSQIPVTTADDGSEWWQSTQLLTTVGAATIIVTITGGVLLLRRGRSNDTPATAQSATEDSQSEPPTDDEQSVAHAQFEAARDRLNDGAADEATITAYGALRSSITRKADVDDRRTHWSFVQACRDNGVDSATVDALEVLTERYEQAAYAPESVPTTAAEESVVLVEDLLGGDNTGAPADD